MLERILYIPEAMKAGPGKFQAPLGPTICVGCGRDIRFELHIDLGQSGAICIPCQAKKGILPAGDE